MINVWDNTGYSENEYDQMSYSEKASFVLKYCNSIKRKLKEIEILKEQSCESPCEIYRNIYCENCRLFIPDINSNTECKALSSDIVGCIKITKFIDL